LASLTFLALLVTGCDDVKQTPVLKNDLGAFHLFRRTYFDKKKQCAEVGWAYYQRQRSELEREFGKDKGGTWVNGPYFAYNSERDS